MATKTKVKRKKSKTPGATPRLAGLLGDAKRLDRIAEIIETVDNRCLACDGPVTPTLQEMEQREISEIYALAKRRK